MTYVANEPAVPALVAEKLAVFDRLAPEFEASFQYVQDMQGQRRFAAIAIAGIVRYLHALWVCDRKDRLLSVPRTIQRYEGGRCLELLRQWHGGESTAVVAFLQRKLDGLPFAEITRQLEAARGHPGGSGVVERLHRGRLVLLNRGFNLHHALDAIFTLSQEELMRQVHAACAEYGHGPTQIEGQLADLASRPYTYVRHPALAQRNMVIMDRLGVHLSEDVANRPGHRTWSVATAAMPSAPYAEEVIAGYVQLTAPRHNNPGGIRFVDRPEMIMPSVTQGDTAP
jgi:hypothetical protein